MKFINSELIYLKDENWLQEQRIAGQCVASCLETCGKLISSEINLSGKDLEEECYKIMQKFNCIPTFYNYSNNGKKPFPGKICVSVNEVMVHGIPNEKLFQEGDVIKIDLGATYNDSVADAATTFIKGQAKLSNHEVMIKLAKQALAKAIEMCFPGKQVGAIGNAIYKTVKDSKFGLITDYGGHGIHSHNKPHASPFVPNKSNATDGVRFQSGMTLAIEPQLVMGLPITRVASDGW